jgi:hypothetical protein
MPPMPGWFPFAAVVVAIGLVFFVTLAARVHLGARLGVGRQGSAETPARDELLRRGLRIQATISSVRSPIAWLPWGHSGRMYVTTATATDLATGQARTFTQRGGSPMGNRGEPVTVLVDPTHPAVYLIVR